MADKAINATSGVTDTTPLATDLIPFGRTSDTTARRATVAAIVQAQAASTSEKGAVELATTAEAQAGASAALAVTPAGLAAYFDQTPIEFGAQGATEPILNLATYGNTVYGQIGTNHAAFYGHNNDLLGVGFNNFSRVAGQATWILGFEYDYYTSAVDHEAEAYFAYTDTDGVTSRRPWQVNINRETLACIHQFLGTVYFNESDGDQLFKIDETNKCLYLFNSSRIESLNNNVSIISQKNAAGDNNISLIKINASDVIEVGSGTFTKFPKGISLLSNPVATLGDTDIQVGNGGGLVTLDYANTGLEHLVTAALNTNHWPYAFDTELGHSGSNVYSKGPHRMIILTAEPGYKPDGLLVYADGTNWNPGSGAGFYGREGNAWVKL